jgi:subtilase family serine protease
MKVFARRHFALPLLALCLAAITAGLAQNSTARVIPNNTPRFVAKARNVGPEDSSKVINVTVWLRLHNQDSLHGLVEQLYQQGSPNYHRWLTPEQFKADYAPKAEEAAAVRNFLAAHNLSVLSVDENNLHVKARGTVGDVQNAFRVQIARFEVNGKTFKANTADPVIEEPVGSLVAAVDGLSDHRLQPYSVRPIDPDTGKPFTGIPLASSPNGAFFSGQCFRQPEVHTFTTGGGLPKATYVGNRYGADITNTAYGTLPPCGYSPAEVQKAYNLNGAYNKGLDGTGQTIVIVDAFGSTSIQYDAALFSSIYGLPAPNLNIIGTPVPPTNADIAGWADETTLDVEWAHSVAPGAAIDLVVATSDNDSDLQSAVLSAITSHLGNVISNSYGEAESDEPPSNLDAWNTIIETGAALGISVNFSSGDSGDSEPSGITPNTLLFGVSTPADSPWATAVGGTSLALNADDSMRFQTGWGTNITEVADRVSLGSPPVVPPFNEGFLYGSGGGVSGYFPKPSFQRGLRGAGRLVPDISYLADPYTGVEIIISPDGVPSDGQAFGSIGGTSLACPMFSALWAIASQKAGGPLGQAARSVYHLPPGAVTDVVPFFSPLDVFGAVLTSTGLSFETPAQLAAPLDNTKLFYSALYNSPNSTRWFVLMFGTDSSLTTGFGWDNVTGVGTPNGLAFINAVAH